MKRLLLCLLLALPIVARAAAPPESVKDNFNRADVPIGSPWIGDLPNVAISGARLKVLSLTPASGNAAAAWPLLLEPMQFAHMTIASTASIPWQCLTLRVQPTSDSRIQVSFKTSSVVVQTRTDGVWQQPVGSAPLVVALGDHVLAKVDSFGVVSVYKNGALALTVPLSTWKYVAAGGYPGLAGAPNMLADDFGFGVWHTASAPPPPNRPPVVVVAAGLTASFTAGGSTDPDGDALAFAWDFGDGSTATGSSVTHSYLAAGSHTATVTVTDGKGGSSSASVVVALTLPGPPPPPPTSIQFRFTVPTQNADNCAPGPVGTDSVTVHWRLNPLGVEDSTYRARGALISPVYTSPLAQQVVVWPSRWGYANGGRYYARGCDTPPLPVAPK